MITITVVQVTDDAEDFFKSLAYSHSGEFPYEVVSPAYEFEIANRVDKKSKESVIDIYLPNNCLVLGNSWDKYIDYALKNGLPKHHLGSGELTWEDYVIRRMGLMAKNQSGIYPELKVELPLATQ